MDSSTLGLHLFYLQHLLVLSRKYISNEYTPSHGHNYFSIYVITYLIWIILVVPVYSILDSFWCIRPKGARMIPSKCKSDYGVPHAWNLSVTSHSTYYIKTNPYYKLHSPECPGLSAYLPRLIWGSLLWLYKLTKLLPQGFHPRMICWPLFASVLCISHKPCSVFVCITENDSPHF